MHFFLYQNSLNDKNKNEISHKMFLVAYYFSFFLFFFIRKCHQETALIKTHMYMYLFVKFLSIIHLLSRSTFIAIHFFEKEHLFDINLHNYK